MPIGGQVIIGVVIIVGVGMLIYEFFRLIKLKKERVEELNERYSDDSILYRENMANCFGRDSEGIAQVRGNGCFIITKDELFFSMLFPRKDITIPIKDIKGLEAGKSFLGKSKFRPLLIINFTNEKGDDERAAWLLKDLPKATDILTPIMS